MTYTEKDIKKFVVIQKIATELEGIANFEGKYGMIDVLTDYDIIQVEYAKNWTVALGKIIAHKIEFPDHYGRIHLMNANSFYELNALKVCSEHDIDVTSDLRRPLKMTKLDRQLEKNFNLKLYAEKMSRGLAATGANLREICSESDKRLAKILSS